MGCISTVLASMKPAAVLKSRPHGLCSSLHEIGATKVHNMAASKWVVLVRSSIAVPVYAYESDFLNALLALNQRIVSCSVAQYAVAEFHICL
jgi:hypothetical protein